MSQVERPALKEILSETPTSAAIRGAVALFHHIALVYLRHKDAAGTLMHAHLALPLEDLALDCISELFERDATGKFIALTRYFDELRWESLSQDDLDGAVRRLVFSAVNQELYRTYKESDPTLHRIIRNIKDASESTPGMHMIQINKDNCLIFAPGDPQRSLPFAPPEYLAPYITGIVAHHDTTASILTEVHDLLSTQKEYFPGYPVIRLALLIRDAYARLTSNDHECASSEPDANEHLHLRDLNLLVAQSVRATGERFHNRYVSNGKIDPAVFRTYLTITEQLLRGEFAGEDDAGGSFFERVRNHLPHVTLEEYRKEHRTTLEYLVKTARTDFLDAARRHCT